MQPKPMLNRLDKNRMYQTRMPVIIFNAIYIYIITMYVPVATLTGNKRFILEFNSTKLSPPIIKYIHIETIQVRELSM